MHIKTKHVHRLVSVGRESQLEMSTLQLNNGFSMPVLGLGTWLAEGEFRESVKHAIKIGYRHIDCAFKYENEEEVGKAIKECIDEGIVKREDLFITTKLWCTFHQPHLVEVACRKSLANLQLDYVDMYLIHHPVAFAPSETTLHPTGAAGKILYDHTPLEDVWQAMEKLPKLGITKSIGVSNFNVTQMDRILKIASIVPATLQIEVNIDLPNDTLIDYCKSKGILVTAYSPLGNPDSPYPTKQTERLIERDCVKEIAAKHQKTPAQVCIRFCLERGLVCLAKSTKKHRIEENFDVFDFHLNEDEMGRLKACGNGRRTVYPTA